MRVLVAMSGGVDSTVAAFLLKAAGHDVAGATMKLFCYGREEGPSRPCCDGEAIRAARRSAEILGIPHTVTDMEEAFRRDVIGDFVSEYESGRTPNPCVQCNSHVKFGPLLDKARRMGFDAVATGHYVRRLPAEPPEDGWTLNRARDRSKDQSYVLWGLAAEQLDSCLFPLGGARKPAVRRLARRLGLPDWDRAESQDICFVPTGEHGRFLADRIAETHPMRRPGPVRNVVDGRRIGDHDGLLGRTIGQRHGIGIAGRERLYVVRLGIEDGTLWVGPRDACSSTGLLATGGNRLAPRELIEGPGVTARIRYRHEPVPCDVRISPEGWHVRFERPEGAVTPGQSVVFYKGDRMLGGARIASAIHAAEGPSHTDAPPVEGRSPALQDAPDAPRGGDPTR
jgi:tRNA-uridine 2-sulfurtransferase